MLPSTKSMVSRVFQIFYLLCQCAASSSRYSATSIASFEMLRDECLHSSFSGEPSVVGTMLLARDTNSSCLQSNGLSAFAYSSQSIAAIKTNLSATHSYLTVEMWVKIANTSRIETELFSLGNHALSSTGSANLAVTYKHQNGRYSFSVSSGNGVSHSTLNPSYVPATVDTASIMHVVVRVEFNAFSFPPFGTFYMVSSNFTFNGEVNTTDSYQRIYSSSDIYAPSTWNSNYRMTLLRSTKAADPADLNVYFLALYGSKLSQGQILQNYAYGLANSLPVVSSCAATINEDGMLGSHYGSPAYYRNPVPATELAVIALQAFDLDEQSYSPSYNSSAAHMKLQVLALNASAGSFFFLDGSPLSVGALVGKNDTGGGGVYGIRFRPLYNKNSGAGVAYTSITYRAIDGSTGLPSAENATLSVYVTAVNDPPYVLPSYSSTATAGLRATYTFTGGDVDSSVTAAYITAVPKNGTLYHVATNGSVLAAITAPGYLQQNGSSVLTFAYKYTGAQHITSQGSGIVATDIFYFAIEDKEGRSSEPANYTLYVYSALMARASTLISTAPAATESVISELTLYGSDTSEAKRSVSLQIVSLPSMGSLYASAAGGEPLVAGATLPSSISSGSYTAGQGAKIYYLSGGSFFTYPTTSWNGSAIPGLQNADSFSFRTVAADGSASLAATQYVGVKNSNGPSEISFVYEGEWVGGEIEIYAYSTKASGQKTSATITGFTIADGDLGVDIIRAHVKVSSSGGKITLNQAKVAQLDFSSTTYCSRTQLPCRGSGYYNSEMVFLGTPKEIEAALNGMKYVSLLPNRQEIVNITLYDGVGDYCLTNALLGASRSARSSCFVRQVSIPINVLGYAGFSDSIDSLFADSESSLRTKIIVLCCCSAIGLVMCRCAYLHAKGKVRLAMSALRIGKKLLAHFNLLPPIKEGVPLCDEFSGSKEGALEGGLAGRPPRQLASRRQDFLGVFGRKSSIRMGRNSILTRGKKEKEGAEEDGRCNDASQDTASEGSCPSSEAVGEAEVEIMVEVQGSLRQQQQLQQEKELLWAEELAFYKSQVEKLERQLQEQTKVAQELAFRNSEMLSGKANAAAAIAGSSGEVQSDCRKYITYTDYGGVAIDI